MPPSNFKPNPCRFNLHHGFLSRLAHTHQIQNRAFAQRPNLAVKWDADKLHRFGTALWAPLTLALGLVE